MSVTLTAPLLAPANPSAVAVADGSLVEGRTYYFKICARTYNSYAVTSSDKRLSPPSSEVNATTDATKKTVTVSWDAVTDAVAYYIYVRWGTENWRCIGTVWTATTTGTTYDFVTEDSIHPSSIADLFALTFDTPLDISKDTGIGIATINGDVTLDEIYDAIVLSYPTYAKKSKGYYVFRFHIKSIETGSLTIPYGTIICPLQCIVENPSPDFIWTWQYSSKLYVNGYGWRAFDVFYNPVFQKKVHIIGGAALGIGYKPLLYGHDNYVNINLDRMTSSNLLIDHIMVQVLGTGILTDIDVISNNIGIQSNTASVENCIANAISLWHNGALGNSYIRDSEMVSTSYNIRIAWAENLGADFPYYDCTFHAISDSDPNKPIIYYYPEPSYHTHTYHAAIYRSIKIKVTKKDGTIITGATVKVWNKDNVLVMDETTDGNGETNKVDIKVVRTSWLSGSASSSVSSYEEFGPFEIKIEKPRYENYECNFTLEEKTDWTIALQDPEIGERTFEIIDISKEIEIIDVSTELEVIEL